VLISGFWADSQQMTSNQINLEAVVTFLSDPGPHDFTTSPLMDQAADRSEAAAVDGNILSPIENVIFLNL